MSRKKKAPVIVLSSWEEADRAVAEMAELSDMITTTTGRLNAAVARVTARYTARTAPFQARHDELLAAIQAYADANREKLTDGGKTKSAKMTAGTIGWRTCPASVAYASGLKISDVVLKILDLIGKLQKKVNKDKDDAEARLQLVQAEGFIRRKMEPNKDAMLDAPATAALVEGVRIVTDKEDFYVDFSVVDLPEPVS
jgi:phage host-nuclease inhibitor protein Gam